MIGIFVVLFFWVGFNWLFIVFFIIVFGEDGIYLFNFFFVVIFGLIGFFYVRFMVDDFGFVFKMNGIVE